MAPTPRGISRNVNKQKAKYSFHVSSVNNNKSSKRSVKFTPSENNQTPPQLASTLQSINPELLRILTGSGIPARHGVEKFDGDARKFENF